MSHLIYVAIGFPPAAKSCAYRMKQVANLLCETGWDVTVVTLPDSSWEREFGIDESLTMDLDPRVGYAYVDVAREDLDPDIRNYSELRAREPKKWLAQLRQQELASFPEPVFGSWRTAIEEKVLEVHAARPADLVMVSPAPNTAMTAALRLKQERGVPYVVDFRDAWSLVTYTGAEAFAVDSPEGRWERDLLTGAVEVWCVNDAIAGFYRARYPELTVRSVPNGFDPFPAPLGPATGSDDGLAFGYLGTSNFPIGLLDLTLDAWSLARQRSDVIAGSRLEFRGHFGAGMAKGATRHVASIRARSSEGVGYHGPVPKDQVPATYEQWDALVLLLPGGEYVTGGKSYEYVGTGRPIVSVHPRQHGASEVLQGYPLWTGAPDEVTVEAVANAFVRTADLALRATPQQRRSAVEHGARFARRNMLFPAVQDLGRRFGDG